MLETEDEVLVWEGKGSNEFERKTAHTMIDRVLEKGPEPPT